MNEGVGVGVLGGYREVKINGGLLASSDDTVTQAK